MKIAQRFPLVNWFLSRSIVYYCLTAAIFAGCIDYYVWHFLYLQQVRQLYYTSEKKDPYSAIRYYEYLVETGLANERDCRELAENYLKVGDTKSARDAYDQAFRRVSPHSDEYKVIMQSYRKDILGIKD